MTATAPQGTRVVALFRGAIESRDEPGQLAPFATAVALLSDLEPGVEAISIQWQLFADADSGAVPTVDSLEIDFAIP